jgi:hypothetical protein
MGCQRFQASAVQSLLIEQRSAVEPSCVNAKLQQIESNDELLLPSITVAFFLLGNRSDRSFERIYTPHDEAQHAVDLFELGLQFEDRRRQSQLETIENRREKRTSGPQHSAARTSQDVMWVQSASTPLDLH